MVTTPVGGTQRDTDLPETPPATLSVALSLLHERFERADLSFGHGTDNAWDEAVQLLLTAMELPADAGEEVLGLHVPDDCWTKVRRWSYRRVHDRVPLPYITGRAWFAELPFICDERALVPRSPLAEIIVNGFRPWWSGAAPHRILDLCCGGGSIGIAAALWNETATVVLADIDEHALALAAENIGFHGVGDRVEVRQGDLLESVAGERFDLILANPPYVDQADLASMPAEFHAEPPIGLGSGVDGLELSRRILGHAESCLTPGGLLFLEVGNSWLALDSLLSHLPLTWVDFSYGGHGVLVVQAEELQAIAQALVSS